MTYYSAYANIDSVNKKEPQMKVKLKTLSEFSSKLLDLVIVLAMGIASYLTIFQDNDFVRVVGVINALQMAKVVYSRWF